MADILIFFCFHSNKPCWTSFLSSKTKEYFTFNEASEAYLNARKRIWKCQPFLNKVYITIVAQYKSKRKI